MPRYEYEFSVSVPVPAAASAAVQACLGRAADAKVCAVTDRDCVILTDDGTASEQGSAVKEACDLILDIAAAAGITGTIGFTFSRREARAGIGAWSGGYAICENIGRDTGTAEIVIADDLLALRMSQIAGAGPAGRAPSEAPVTPAPAP